MYVKLGDYEYVSGVRDEFQTVTVLISYDIAAAKEHSKLNNPRDIDSDASLMAQ